MLLRGVFEPLKLPIDPRQLSVLMVKRKDSMSYMEFIRGKYEISNVEYVKRLIKHMTIAEQNSISSSDFSVLWTKLWGNSRDTDSIEFDIARDKFNSVPIQKLVKEVPSIFVEPEWGFPKGRRMRGESDVACATREFFEETNIPAESYTVLPNLTFNETFVGTNDIKYKHVYFVALLQDSKLINLSQKLTPMQRREVSAVEWKTMMECKMITRPHYAERKKIIENLENQVKIYKS
jgi:8-oxo-dGTP pyrophosphatase MutT (NUDIX family)